MTRAGHLFITCKAKTLMYLELSFYFTTLHAVFFFFWGGLCDTEAYFEDGVSRKLVG